MWLAFVGELMGTCLGMVGVVLLTRASKVDQQVSPQVQPAAGLLVLLSLSDIYFSTCMRVHTYFVSMFSAKRHVMIAPSPPITYLRLANGDWQKNKKIHKYRRVVQKSRLQAECDIFVIVIWTMPNVKCL